MFINRIINIINRKIINIIILINAFCSRSTVMPGKCIHHITIHHKTQRIAPIRSIQMFTAFRTTTTN